VFHFAARPRCAPWVLPSSRMMRSCGGAVPVQAQNFLKIACIHLRGPYRIRSQRAMARGAFAGYRPCKDIDHPEAAKTQKPGRAVSAAFKNLGVILAFRWTVEGSASRTAHAAAIRISRPCQQIAVAFRNPKFRQAVDRASPLRKSRVIMARFCLLALLFASKGTLVLVENPADWMKLARFCRRQQAPTGTPIQTCPKLRRHIRHHRHDSTFRGLPCRNRAAPSVCVQCSFRQIARPVSSGQNMGVQVRACGARSSILSRSGPSVASKWRRGPDAARVTTWARQPQCRPEIRGHGADHSPPLPHVIPASVHHGRYRRSVRTISSTHRGRVRDLEFLVRRAPSL